MIDPTKIYTVNTCLQFFDGNKSNIKIYELWLDHTYRTYETLTKGGYRTYEFEGKPVENREH